MTMRPALASLLLLLPCAASFAAPPAPTIVDEPLGARYSLGLTLWHLGHQAPHVERFHSYLKQAGQSPRALLPADRLKPPAALHSLLLDPELLTPAQLNGWVARGDCAVSGATDAGPTMSLPLHVTHPGLYRVWVRYLGRPGCRGVTSLTLYRTGAENLGPLYQPDEFYDEPPAEAGPQWHDLLVDLPAGDLTLKIGHVTRLWQGPGGYDERQVDCLYLTEALWQPPPVPERLTTLRAAATPAGAQRSFMDPLPQAERDQFLWWQVRPLSWEDAAANPRLFELSRRFWQQTVDALAQQEYGEAAEQRPDYRAPQRQVVFNSTWNLMANPVRARRQIEVLTKDVSPAPLPYHYVWHDVASGIPALAGPDRPSAYGGWTAEQGCLFASYGTPRGTVSTDVPVQKAGRYAVWVLSSSTNLSYTAPWIGTATVAGREQFRYRHEGKIPSVWMKMGEVTLDRPGPVKVGFTLDDAGPGSTYRRIYTLLLIDDLDFVPRGTVRPPWTLEQYRERARQAGAKAGEKVLVWTTPEAYTPLSQEVWADQTTAGRSWPEGEAAPSRQKKLLMARETCRAVQVVLRNLTDQPLTFRASAGPLQQGKSAYAGKVTWRVQAFVPYGPERQDWSPFMLLRRPAVTVPPLSVAGLWLTVDARGVPEGEYVSRLVLRAAGVPDQTVTLKVRVSGVAPAPKQPVLVDGYTGPPEGDQYCRDFRDHGLKVWRGMISRSEMRRWGLRLTGINAATAADVAAVKALGLDYDDWFAVIHDEPCGTTEEALKPFLDVAKALRQADPRVRISFNPGEAAELKTFELLAPYCDFWLPYAKHLSPNWGGREKWAIYKAKPWMWYTTPCLWDKSPLLPQQTREQIRQVPGQSGQCVGTAFFALNYPFRDAWDTAYEYLPDASVMGALSSRHGPVPTRTWEAIREGIQEADLALLLREKCGAKVFDDLTDEETRRLVTAGTTEELLQRLESR